MEAVQALLQECRRLRRMEKRYKSILERLQCDEALVFARSPRRGLEEHPDEAVRAELCERNPRLMDLKRRYAAVRRYEDKISIWTEHYVQRGLDMRCFRADNAFVYQYRDLNFDVNYALTYEYLLNNDDFGFLERLDEDGLFGIHGVAVGRRIVTRDLLDSVSELSFLERQLRIRKWGGVRILDIGAGYGRLAYRACSVLRNLNAYYCVDAVPESTFLCEFYLKYRKVPASVKTIPYDEIGGLAGKRPINLAVNIHSFSECPISAIGEWIDICRRCRIRYLMIVPNYDEGNDALLSCERDGRELPYAPLISDAGYRQIAKVPKYGDPTIQLHGVSPTFYYLFELARIPKV
jgi:SAM-dependent methyltransferase